MARLPAEPVADSDRVIVLFDAGCRLCRASAAFAERRDWRRDFQFIERGSPAAETAFVARGALPPPVDAIVLLERGQVYLRSDAVLRLLGRLSPPWCWLARLRVIPRRLRDDVYEVVAAHRVRWFGRAP